MQVKISFYHDKRRKKDTGVYPIKLQVFRKTPRKQKLYGLGVDASIENFEKLVSAKRLNQDLRVLKLKLEKIKADATYVVEKIKPFSFEDFEKQYFKIQKAKSVNAVFDLIIKEYQQEQKIGRATVFESSLKKLIQYHTHKGKTNDIKFSEITVKWLNDFQRWYTTIHITKRKKHGSLTSVGIICRDLRAVYNRAIKEKLIGKEKYPFGIDAYAIPTGGGTARALTLQELELIFKSEPQTLEQQRAKDFFLFSYATNGMNLTDVCRLLKTDFNKEDSTITYVRKKTATKKKENHLIEIPLNEYALNHIELYYNSNSMYLFDVLNDTDNETEKVRKIKNFVSSINKAIKKLARSVGITSKISTYYARHTFADLSLKQFGASMEQVSEMLNHSSLKTTKSYIGSFSRESKKNLNDNLFNFG